MTTTLITGANKGLGHESARRLIDAGHDVWVGARDATAGQDAADKLGARFVQLDVTDDASVAAAVQTIRDAGTGLDVLINNAGIVGPMAALRDTTADDVAKTYETNVFGVVRVTQAFVPLLEESENPVIVNVASGLGSLAVNNDTSRVENTIISLGYPTSKTAVVALSDMYARALPSFRVNVVDPGYTATDLNGHSGHQTVTEGTDAIVAMAQVGKDGPTQTFQDRDGLVPW
ncbi:SDR family NAD(P)-dependent oxidoreductase [Baekduia sp. Peel2402]|uniref:SDR family NAD(P)-dependent oxidoreductase n=1 Tax=Baekduia sp. Peel2402 TaxID=3458296 RepID=UPI00403ED549